VVKAEAYLRTKWHLDPSSRLATTHGPKVGAAVPPFWGGDLVLRVTQCRLKLLQNVYMTPSCSSLALLILAVFDVWGRVAETGSGNKWRLVAFKSARLEQVEMLYRFEVFIL